MGQRDADLAGNDQPNAGRGGFPAGMLRSSGIAELPVSVVAISSLLPADSPRLAGEDLMHSTVLAGVDGVLPPILVHRPTMRVIDGMHRLRAALIRNDTTIEARLFDGDEDVAFMLAVEANITHGLPLSLADREAAAARICTLRPELSDRAIAQITGLSGQTVGTIRRRATANVTQLHARVGRDGRVRPISTAQGRQLASELIEARPEASLREIAKIAGVSPGTVRDVRKRVLRGEDPIPESQRRGQSGNGERSARRRQVIARDTFSTLRELKRDPSLRFSDAGRTLLRLLAWHAIRREDLAELIRVTPPHSASVIADLARECAEVWLKFAKEIERKDDI